MEKNNSIDDLINNYYIEDNFLIKEYSLNNSNICYIFFSSLGIYKHNDIDGLLYIHEHDKYEWKSLCENKTIIKHCKRIIFIRDIKKQFYLDGINKRINTIKKLALFLKKETNGLDVYLVGSSAGGYAAYIISNYLDNVKRIYSLGGVVDLKEHSTFLERQDINKHIDVDDLVTSINQKAFVIHCYGFNNQESLRGVAVLSRIIDGNKALFIPLNSKDHAPRPSGHDLIKLLTCTDEHLYSIKKQIIRKKSITFFRFSIINLGFFRAIIYGIKKFLKGFINKDGKKD